MGSTEQRVVRGDRLVKTKRDVVSIAAVVGFLGAGGAVAQSLDCAPPDGGPDGSTICSLGTLTGGAWSYAYGVSADGSIVVGESGSDEGRAFRWTAGSGMESLGILSGGSYSYAFGVSADGLVVVGGSGSSDGFRAFRWEADSGMESLGTLAGGTDSRAYRASADGSIVVGYSDSSDGFRAFRWTADSGMESLGKLEGSTLEAGNRSYAWGVSADGSVVVGYSDSKDGLRAFRWEADSGMESLGTLAGGTSSLAYDVSADGSVVVGDSDSNDGDRAFRWTADSGMESLGTLAGGISSTAYGLSADGSVVVGFSDSSDGERAFRWMADSGMESLGTLAGGTWSYAWDVSADGSVVVGYSDSSDGDRAFIWRAGTMEDHANLITSFPVLGNDSAVMQAEQQFALGQVMSLSGMATAGQSIMSASAATEVSRSTSTSMGARATSLGALSFGRGISDTFTLGATISLSGTSLNNNAFAMDTGFGAAIWGNYSEGGLARTGLQAGAAIGYMRAHGEVARGRLLTDVALATGRSSGETRAAQASVGYGFQHADWLLTPTLGVAHYDTRRAAYTESGAAFNASYDAMTTGRSVANFDAEGEFAVSDQGRLSLGVGVEHDLSVTTPRLTGTSDIPGLMAFDIGSTLQANRTRGFVTAGYTHDFGNDQSLGGTLRVGQAVYGNTPSIGVGLSYSMRF